MCLTPQSRLCGPVAHEKGTIEGPFVNNRGYHVQSVFTLVGGEGR